MTTDQDKFDDRLDELRLEQQKASQRGNHAKADRLYAQEQELISQRHGRRPIVNGSQRTA